MRFTEEQVQETVWGDHEDFEVVEEIDGEDRRWTRTNEVIVQQVSTGKLFKLHYEQGLTEMQENMYEAQDAPEVKKVTKTITTEVTSYEAV